MTTEVPKAFLDAFPEDNKPVIHYAGNPIGCPDYIERSDDGSMAWHFPAQAYQTAHSRGINPLNWVGSLLQKGSRKVLSYGKT